jgi:hypothetical protein
LTLIRYGYEITLNCARPTALVCLLSVHDDHDKAIRVRGRVFPRPSSRRRPIAIFSAINVGGWWRPPAI